MSSDKSGGKAGGSGKVDLGPTGGNQAPMPGKDASSTQHVVTPGNGKSGGNTGLAGVGKGGSSK
jgi:hypothetical protein